MRLEPEERRNYVHSQLDDYGRLYMSCLEMFVQKLWCKQRLLIRTNRIYEEKLATISEIIGKKSNEVLNATKNDCDKIENIIQKMHRIIFIPPNKDSDLHILNDLLSREAEETLWEDDDDEDEDEDLTPPPSAANHHYHHAYRQQQVNNCVPSSHNAAHSRNVSASSREPSARVINASVRRQQQQQQQQQLQQQQHQANRRDLIESNSKNNNGHCISSSVSQPNSNNSSPSRRMASNESNNHHNSSAAALSSIEGRRVSNVSTDGEVANLLGSSVGRDGTLGRRSSSKRANGGSSSAGSNGSTSGSVSKKSRNNRTKDDKEIVKCCAQHECEYIERDNANNMRKHYRNWHDNIEYPTTPYMKKEMNTEMVNQFLHNWMVQRKKRQPLAGRNREMGSRPSTDSWPSMSTLDGVLMYQEDQNEDEDYEINDHLISLTKTEKSQENSTASSASATTTTTQHDNN
ncbi:uncharacterized protein LOC141855029 [Brevipalpus obovatus]|uniref:uncharacterized protein LOC141855029 n=1 Tax=Brevipalpus obovatus TaxID=246614 RepID=UPI003D9E4747